MAKAGRSAGPTYVAKLQHAAALHQAGNLDAAAGLYRQVLDASPRDPVALRLYGIVNLQQGQIDQAEQLLTRSIRHDDQIAESHYWLGRVFLEKRNTQRAAFCLNRCVALDPNHAVALSVLGSLAVTEGAPTTALDLFDRALKVDPAAPDVWFNRAVVFQDMNRFQDALSSYERAIALRPDFVDAIYNRGLTLQALSRFEDALASYDRVIALKPDYVVAYNNRGNVLRALKQPDEALESFARAAALMPGYAEALYNQGLILHDLHRLDDAIAAFEKAVAARPDFAEAKFALCMAELPVVFVDEAEIAKRRAAFERRIRALHDEVMKHPAPGFMAPAVGVHQPFYLACQAMNDRDLLATYGALTCRIMTDRYPPVRLPPPPGPNERVRVGIVSGFFWQHTVWKIGVKGWLQLDQKRFQVFGYHTSARQDAETAKAAAALHRFVQGPHESDRWREMILADAPHVLMYSDIGMDAMSARLAVQRLAPTQCSYWGHPDTSGFPSIDYFLTSDLMEPANGDGHYTERLVRLPNLSVYYEPTEIAPAPVTRDELGLRPDATVYWSGTIAAQISAAVRRGLSADRPRGAGLPIRIYRPHRRGHGDRDVPRAARRAFAAHGLDAADHCVVLPRLDTARFIGAMAQADVVLDTIGWSGGNTTLESLPLRLPVVTLPTGTMRGRHSTAILTQMGVTDTIASTIDDYVAMAVRLGRDPPLARGNQSEDDGERTQGLSGPCADHGAGGFSGSRRSRPRAKPPSHHLDVEHARHGLDRAGDLRRQLEAAGQPDVDFGAIG